MIFHRSSRVHFAAFAVCMFGFALMGQGEKERTTCIAVQDLDRDGFPDVVFGNRGGPDQIPLSRRVQSMVTLLPFISSIVKICSRTLPSLKKISECHSTRVLSPWAARPSAPGCPARFRPSLSCSVTSTGCRRHGGWVGSGGRAPDQYRLVLATLITPLPIRRIALRPALAPSA